MSPLSPQAPLNHAYWMQQALTLAQKAQTLGEIPVAALIVDADDRLLVADHNRTCMDNDATAHAEILAIRQAGALIGAARLNTCRLYVTLEPCPMCAGAIIQARLESIIFAAYDPKMGAVEHGIKLFTQPSSNHHPNVIGGVCEVKAKKMLQDFFAQKRPIKRL